MKNWLIAHRGAQCDGRENTIAAFGACQKYPLGWVELDLHTTKDGVVICHHDCNINELNIATTSYKDLKIIDGQLTTFKEATKALDNIPLIVEIKPTGTAKHIINELYDHPAWLVASFNIEAIKELISLGVDKKRIYLLQRKNSVGHINNALANCLGGVGVNQRLLTPRFYLKAVKNGLSVYTYTVNSPWQAKLFRSLYPKIKICSDRVDLLQNIK